MSGLWWDVTQSMLPIVVVAALLAQGLVLWRRGGSVSLILGYAFLYLPILTVIFLSFNANERSSVWGGFTTEFYGDLIGPKTRDLRNAAWTSIRVGPMASGIGVILGVLAALCWFASAAFGDGKFSRA